MSYYQIVNDLKEVQRERNAVRARERELKKKKKELCKKNLYTKEARKPITKELRELYYRVFPLNRKITELKKARARAWPEEFLGDADGKCLN